MWHLSRELAFDGAGWAHLYLGKIAKIFSVTEGTVENWIKEAGRLGYFNNCKKFKSGLGVYYWVRYKSARKMLAQQGVETPFVFEIPIKRLKKARISAAHCLTYLQQDQSLHQAKTSAKTKGLRTPNTIAIRNKASIDRYPVNTNETRYIPVKVSFSREKFSFFDQICPRQVINLGTFSPFQGSQANFIYRTSKYSVVHEETHAPYGTSQASVAKEFGLSLRTLSNYFSIRYTKARKLSIYKTRLCITGDSIAESFLRDMREVLMESGPMTVRKLLRKLPRYSLVPIKALKYRIDYDERFYTNFKTVREEDKDRTFYSVVKKLTNLYYFPNIRLINYSRFSKRYKRWRETGIWEKANFKGLRPSLSKELFHYFLPDREVHSIFSRTFANKSRRYKAKFVRFLETSLNCPLENEEIKAALEIFNSMIAKTKFSSPSFLIPFWKSFKLVCNRLGDSIDRMISSLLETQQESNARLAEYFPNYCPIKTNKRKRERGC